MKGTGANGKAELQGVCKTLPEIYSEERERVSVKYGIITEELGVKIINMVQIIF